MKKALFLFAGAIMMVFAVSCGKSTTYEVYNGTSDIPLYNIKVYEYSGSSMIKMKDVGTLYSNSSSGSIEATRGADQVQLTFRLEYGGDVYTTADYYSLRSGEHTMIRIDDYTQVYGGSKDALTVEKAAK